MQMPNWFDTKYETAMGKATAEQALEIVSKDPQIVRAVKDALAEFDKHPGRPGPSRTQAVRDAIAQTLQAV